ncbi:hydrolase 1, exosortase A system-associated [Sphingomonas sp. So64.6b]|uniref:hydrolase 1, exosortase A system-associated n=1 Tax=Sphingomonas sp. So64.6b TaxID=2997354 RepID=UPI0015FF5020|nr:hydrolase 1, exosortase A system-associated [Sphingomonas sp. So64.6b]QNA84093.1 hydrolase 1, exosortase A system-associated [Sphingomonas sp. So64.6b]
MRRIISFPCAGETLAGTIDEATGTTGLLIVSGGNEIRIGAHRGMASLAAGLARAGIPVFRYDRRGIGDSTGENGGFAASADDIKAAAAAFRAAAPHLTRLAAFGNCDAATSLALFHRDADIETLILANPWVIEDSADDDLPPAAAIRARYIERLRDPATWLRLIRGGVDLRKLFKGLAKASKKENQQPDNLAARIRAALSGHTDSVTFVLARQDATAIAFADACRQSGWAPQAHIIDTASHSFARAGDAAELEAVISAQLTRD